MRKIIKLGVTLIAVTALLSACDSRIANHPPGSNPWLDGNPGQFVKFASAADTGPVFMLNLLKFDETTAGGEITGAESYAKYGELAGPIVAKHGGELIWAGVPTEQLIGDMDYDWDLVAIVKWPKRQNLIDLGEDSDYEEISHFRGDGLKRSMLIAMDQVPGLGTR